MPKLIVKRRPGHPVVIPVVAHHCKVYPLQGQLSDLSTQIWTRPYLLIRQVMLAIASMEVESSILPRDLVPHGAFESTVVDKRHSKYKRSWWRGDKQVVEPRHSDRPRLYRIKGITPPPHIHISKPTSPPFKIMTHHATITPL